jgi:hypothetical protein
VVPEVRAHAEQIDDRHDITNSKERLDEWEPHVKHYASSRLEVAGRAKLAKGAAAIWGAIGSSNKMVQLIIVTRRKTRSVGPMMSPAIPCSTGVHSIPNPRDGWDGGDPIIVILAPRC